MAGHTNANGFQRKYMTALNGQNDSELTGFFIQADIAAGTASTTVLSDAQIPPGHKVHITKIEISSDGAAWTGGTNIILRDTSSTPINFLTVTTANLPTSTAGVVPGLLGTSTVGQGMATGGGAGRGLVVAQTGTYAGAAVLSVRVTGFVQDPARLTLGLPVRT